MKRIVERITCPDCHGAGETYFKSKNHPSFAASNDCERCDGEGEFDFDVATLANNLAVAAALTKAFDLGRYHEMWMDGFYEGWHDDDDDERPWHPGCGKAAP